MNLKQFLNLKRIMIIKNIYQQDMIKFLKKERVKIDMKIKIVKENSVKKLILIMKMIIIRILLKKKVIQMI